MSETNAARVGAGRTAALYARAPEAYEHNRTTIEEQLAAGRALAEGLGYTVSDAATFSDATPGTTAARPGLTALIGLVAKREADALIVHTLDRLGKPESELLEALLKQLRQRGVPVYLAKTPRGYGYDPATGKLIHDAAEVAAANREDWRRPDYILVPYEDNPDKFIAFPRDEAAPGGSEG